jgi:serine/threonine protein kinase
MESNMKFAGTTFDRACQIGMQLLYQMEVLHFLGYVHGDLKLQNITYNVHLNRYTITDFTSVTKIFHKNGVHKEVGRNRNFCTNIMFASEAMVNQISISRRDDLESLMLLICYLKSGTLPVVEYINANLDVIDINKFIDDVLQFRIKNFKECKDQTKELLGEKLQSAYIYVTELVHNQKPDYKLLKLLMAQTEADEQQIIEEQQEMKRITQRCKHLMYNDVPRQQHHLRGRRMEEKKNGKEEDAEFEFDENLNEFQKNEHDIEFYCRRVDNDRVRKNKLRHIILNHNFNQSEAQSQDSLSSNNNQPGSIAQSSDSLLQQNQIE